MLSSLLPNENQEFPQKYFRNIGHGEPLHNAHDSRRLLAGFLLSVHHIFMQALARLRE